MAYSGLAQSFWPHGLVLWSSGPLVPLLLGARPLVSMLCLVPGVLVPWSSSLLVFGRLVLLSPLWSGGPRSFGQVPGPLVLRFTGLMVLGPTVV